MELRRLKVVVEASPHMCEQYSKTDLIWETQRVYRLEKSNKLRTRKGNANYLASVEATDLMYDAI